MTQNSQAALEAELLTNDIAKLTCLLNWAVSQGVPERAINEMRDKVSVLTSARDQFLASI